VEVPTVHLGRPPLPTRPSSPPSCSTRAWTQSGRSSPHDVAEPSNPGDHPAPPYDV